MVSLNLDNFECENLSSLTPYVLSSPTSLRACDQLRIRPKELVYRSLEEYEELYSDLPLSTIYQLYDSEETKRQEKLLMCRAMRDKILRSSPRGKSASLITPRGSRSASQGPRVINQSQRSPRNNVTSIQRYSPKILNFQEPNMSKGRSEEIIGVDYGSCTESNEGRNSRGGGGDEESEEEEEEEGEIEERARTDDEGDNGDKDLYSTRSVPDLRDNLHFGKVSPFSPRGCCPCQSLRVDGISREKIYSNYMNRYGDILNSSYLNGEDRKILECLILKKGKEVEWEKRSQEFRGLLERERLQRYKERQKSTQSLLERLAEKRQKENMENARRFQLIEDRVKEQRSGLLRTLEERDHRVQKYLDDLQYQKKKQMIEKHRLEAERQLEVGKALQKLVDDDQRHRDLLRERLMRRMEDAQTRKMRREKDYWRHIAEMNRLEEVKRALQLERVEQKKQRMAEELRNQIEEKEHRARMRYLENINARQRDLSAAGGSHKMAIEKARALHQDLLKGLEEWHIKVSDIQQESQRRAQEKYLSELNRKRCRVAAERVLRVERNSEILKRVRENEEKRRDLYKMVIECKEGRGERVKSERDRRIQLSRVRAQHAAELRSRLRERIDPDTFDKKAARAEVETRFLRRNHNLNYSLNGHRFFLNRRGDCSCRCKNGNNPFRRVQFT